ncbi:MAG: hypothetical protein HUN05_23715 [Desulfobacter sp.]|nr:MAG: hypothetical protein HUN05_23715 [Desulfobacter sp.]
MSFTINTNTSALGAVRQTHKAHQSLSDSLERIATGKRINSASDDASGMTIADRLKSQHQAAGQEIQNASASISIAQTAEGALGEMSDILQNIRTKTIEAASGLQSGQSLEAIQSDIQGSLNALKDIAQTTSYNGQTLLDGTFSQGNLNMDSMDPSNLGSGGAETLADIDITTAQGAQEALTVVDQALDQVSQARSGIGSVQNQYLSEIDNLSTSRINLMAAESQIRDTDLAEESILLNQAKAMRQAEIYALNHSNDSKKKLIDLLG